MTVESIGFIDYAKTKMLELSENPTFKQINTALNKQADSIATFIDNSPIVKLFDEKVTSKLADFYSKAANSLVAIREDGSMDFSGIHTKHFNMIVAYNVNAAYLISTVAGAALFGVSSISLITIGVSLVAGRILGKIVTSKDILPLSELDVVQDEKSKTERFAKFALNAIAKITTAPIKLTLYDSTRLLGVFRTLPIT